MPPLTLSLPLVTQRLVLEPFGPPRAEPPAGKEARGGGVGRTVCTTCRKVLELTGATLALSFFSKPLVLKEKILFLPSYISTEFCFFAPIGDE